MHQFGAGVLGENTPRSLDTGARAAHDGCAMVLERSTIMGVSFCVGQRDRESSSLRTVRGVSHDPRGAA